MTTQVEMIGNAPSYVFDQKWQKELERLRSIEASFDPASRRYPP